MVAITLTHSAEGLHVREDRSVLIAGSCSGRDTSGGFVTTLCIAELDPTGALTDYGPPPGTTPSGTVALTELEPQAPDVQLRAQHSLLSPDGQLFIAFEQETTAGTRAGIASINDRGSALDAVRIRPPQPGSPDQARFGALAYASSDRLVAAGTVRRSIGTDALLVAAYAPSLQPDSTFGTNGESSFGNFNQTTVAMVDIEVDSEGRILVFSTQLDLNENQNFCSVVRFLPQGSVDVDFANQGQARIPIALDCASGAMSVDSEDRVVVFGSTRDIFENDRDLFVSRLLTNGNQDSTFNLVPGGGGFLLIEAEDLGSFGPDESAGDLRIQQNGSIFLVGSAQRLGAGNNRLFLTLRLMPEGALDAGYGVGGLSAGTFADAPSEGISDSGKLVAFDPSGYAVIGGTSSANSVIPLPVMGVARIGNVEALVSLLFADAFE